MPTYPDKTDVAHPTIKATTVNMALIHESDTPKTTNMKMARYSAKRNSCAPVKIKLYTS